MHVAFIGLGVMGRPMAANLIAAGHALYLHSRSGVPGDLLNDGGTPCASAREAAERAEVVITMVPDTPHVEAALFGQDGVAAGVHSGAVVVDMSSISPLATKDFAERIEKIGCTYLDAPVSGGDVGARDGTLTIMVGGPQAAFESGPSSQPWAPTSPTWAATAMARPQRSPTRSSWRSRSKR